jgi:DNA-binding winged helix-turn-helix (wHTH) protein
MEDKPKDLIEPSHFESLYPPSARFSEIEKILSFIKAGNCAQIISLPGVGRSNIMGLLSYNRQARNLHLKENEKWYHFVMMNFAQIKGRPLMEATKYMFLELLDSLEERKMTDEHEYVHNIFSNGLKLNDELVLFQALKKTIDYLCLQKELTVVFLFDRFEEYLPMLEPQFFSNLRALRDRAKFRFSAVFPLNRPLEESVGHDMLSNYYELIEGNIVYLSISDEEIMGFRISYREKVSGEKIEKQYLDEIKNLTGGHGKLTRICVEAVLSVDNKPLENHKSLTEFLLSKKRVQAVLGEICKAFTPYEINLIEEGKEAESSHLIAVGLVRNHINTIPLIKTYIESQIKEDINQKIIYEESSKNIIQGNINLSENLTSSEYKLLKFLAQNPDRIIDRDDVVNVVWGDLSSTAGVTEQALDQLIFRVRKKIEENPNVPTHLQTVKGRGFKFTA